MPGTGVQRATPSPEDLGGGSVSSRDVISLPGVGEGCDITAAITAGMSRRWPAKRKSDDIFAVLGRWGDDGGGDAGGPG